MCQPNFNLQNNNSEILNNNNENATIPLPFNLEEIQNYADEDEVELPAEFEFHIPLPDIQENYVDDDNEALQADVEANLSLNHDDYYHNHEYRSGPILADHENNNHNALLTRSQRRNRRRRLQRRKNRQQMRRNIKDIKKFLRRSLSTLKRMKSLMMQQVELVRNMRYW